MASDYLVVDNTAFENLFRGAGNTASAWDQLLSSGKKIVLSSVIEAEIDRRTTPTDFRDAFNRWVADKKIPIVNFEADGIRYPADDPTRPNRVPGTQY
jgi:hypothetical protein